MNGVYKVYDKEKNQWIDMPLFFKGDKGESASVISGEGEGSSVSGYNSKAVGKYSTAEGGLDYVYMIKNIDISSLENSQNDYIYTYTPSTFNSEIVNWCIVEKYPINTLVAIIDTDNNNISGYQQVYCTGCNPEENTITFSGPLHTEPFESLSFAFPMMTEGSLVSEAKGDSSHAENCSKAIGVGSHAEGCSLSIGGFSHAEGQDTKAYGYSSHTEGDRTLTTPAAPYSHAEGHFTIANGRHAHAEGCSTEANNYYTHAEGYKAKASGNTAHAEGHTTLASGTRSHAEGYFTQAIKANTHAEGSYTVAGMQNAHAEGYKTEAAGEHSHAEGHTTKATASKSHAEGGETLASGECSHAEGYKTVASGKYSHASGYSTVANGERSFACGSGVVTNNSAEFACGKYNNSQEDTLFSIGIGTKESNRKNALEVKKNGDIYILIDGVPTKLQDLLK